MITRQMEIPSLKKRLSQCLFDEEDGYQFLEFSFDSDMKNPQFEIGQIFSSASKFREAMRSYSVLNGYNIKFTANEVRVHGVSKFACKWKIWASIVDASEWLQVKSYTSEHTCNWDQFNRYCNYIFLMHCYIDNPDQKIELILATIKNDLHRY